MSLLFQLIGYAGTLLSIFAYLRQITHLIAEHCSAGISLRAFSLWLLASLCIFLYGISIMSWVIIVLQAVNLVANSIVIFYSNRYKDSYCPSHLPVAQAKEGTK